MFYVKLIFPPCHVLHELFENVARYRYNCELDITFHDHDACQSGTKREVYKYREMSPNLYGQSGCFSFS